MFSFLMPAYGDNRASVKVSTFPNLTANPTEGEQGVSRDQQIELHSSASRVPSYAQVPANMNQGVAQALSRLPFILMTHSSAYDKKTHRALTTDNGGILYLCSNASPNGCRFNLQLRAGRKRVDVPPQGVLKTGIRIGVQTGLPILCI